MKHRKVIIIGAGASGMTAAIQAARANADVTLIEHDKKAGKKLLMTGNGKCNLTNTDCVAESYFTDDFTFVDEVLEQFSLHDTIRFFTELGIYTRNRNGYLYPYSEQAESVRSVLLMELEHLKVRLKQNEEITDILHSDSGWEVKTADWTYTADAVILATGSCASAIPGADGSGYRLVSQLGHTIRTPLPALVPLTSDSPVCRHWSGVRAEALLSLYVDGDYVSQNRGNVQFTEYGLSGIPTFQLSHEAVVALHNKQNVYIEIDFLPDITDTAFEQFWTARKTAAAYKTQEEQLIGLFADKLIPILCDGDFKTNCKHFRLPITDFHSFDMAQVCSGGVSLEEISPYTLESTLFKNLYFAGEIMDVDGRCGGYNLQWAWSTGSIAGRHAAKCEE
ncbi:MAG: aminoacetone oxidase family FAD-binding enzyme [Lachnospiraceae bacterium]